MGPVAIYRATCKKQDIFWNAYVCRPPAAVVVYALAGTRVTPNQVTLSALALAALAALLLIFAPGYWGALAAVVVFEVSYVLDCVDGMLARLRGIQSTLGHLLDFLMDEIKAFVILGAVAIRLFRDHHDVNFLLLGVGGLVSVASGIALTTFLRRPEIAGSPSPASPSPPAPSLLRRILRIPERVAKFLVHYPSYILYAALAGRLEYYLYPYIVVNALYAALTLLGVARRFGGFAATPPGS